MPSMTVNLLCFLFFKDAIPSPTVKDVRAGTSATFVTLAIRNFAFTAELNAFIAVPEDWCQNSDSVHLLTQVE